MIDIYIFGFGLAVSIVVGFGLTSVIVVKNRAIEADEAADGAQSEAAPAQQRS